MMKTERASSRRIRQIRRGFLYLEAVAVVLLLPAAARFSGDLLRRASGVVLSPRFVFLLGNAIVLLLFRSSGRLLSPSSAAGDVISDLLDHHHSPPLLQEEEEEEEEEEEDNVAVDDVEEEEEVVAAEESPEIRREGEEESDDVEFRRTVEAFIERQLRFRRQESMEIVFSATGTDTLEIVPAVV